MRKHKVVRTEIHEHKKLEDLLNDGWLVELSNTWDSPNGETKYMEYIVGKDIEPQIEDDVDKYIL